MITNNCETCTPCEGCEYDQYNAQGEPLCDKKCGPCSSQNVCAYCGNHFLKCEDAVETEDGPMHSDCEEKDRKESRAIVNLINGRQ